MLIGPRIAGACAAAVLLPCLAAAPAESPHVVLANDHARFEFQLPHMGLAALVDKGTGVDHMSAVSEPGATLWRISFRAGPATEDVIGLANTDGPATSHGVESLADGTVRVTATWNGLTVGDDEAVVDVKVTAELPPTTGIAAWRIWVTNRSATWGLWEVVFPCFSGTLQAGAYDVAAPTCNWGLLMRNQVAPLVLPYPHGYSMTMQFLCAMKGQSAVYMATHDPRAWPKTFTCAPGTSFSVTTPVANMGVPGSDFAAPFPVMVGVYRGHWMEACKIYRAFATTAPWTSNGRLQPHESATPSAADVALWMRVGDETPEESLKLLRQAHEYFGVPLGVHWYFWHANPFDDELPDYLPAKPGFAEAWRELTRDGFVVMPYINGRLASVTARNFDAYKPCLCLDRHGRAYEEKFGKDMDHPVCPVSPLWQDTMAEICDGIAALGANAVYFDQISGEPPVLCFDAAHGHPLGGGGWWVDGYQRMLNKAREAGHRRGVDLQLMGEFPAEPYMGGLNGFLIWTTRLESSIPMLTAVYSGYTSTFGTNTFFSYSDRAWIMREGRELLWGNAHGWIHPAMLLAPEHATKGRFFKQLGNMRQIGRKYLTYGELVELIDHPSETVTETWPSHNAGDVTLPKIQGALWKALDGSLGVFLVNYDNEESTIPLEIDTDRHGLIAHDDGRYHVARLTLPGNRREESVVSTPILKRSETLGPWEIRLLVISR